MLHLNSPTNRLQHTLHILALFTYCTNFIVELLPLWNLDCCSISMFFILIWMTFKFTALESI